MYGDLAIGMLIRVGLSLSRRRKHLGTSILCS